MATAYLSLAISETDINIANNTSSVQVTVYAYGNGVSWNNSAPGQVTVAGTTYSFNAKFTTSTGQQKLYTTAKKIITHNATGGASVACSAVFWTGTTDAGTLRASRTFTLSTIPRATQPTVSPTTTLLGSPVTISMPRVSTDFLHSLTYKIGDLSGNLGTGLGTSLTWTPPLTLASAITNGANTLTFTCTTYNGSTVIGSKTADLNVTLPASVPTVEPDEIIIGQSVNIYTNSISSMLTHTIRYNVNGDVGIIATNVVDSISWTPPTSLAKDMDGSIGEISIVCDTYNSTTLIGSNTVSLQLVVDTQSIINNLLQFTKVSSTIDFKVERSSLFGGQVMLSSTNTQDAFEELNKRIVPNGRVFTRLNSVPLTMQNFAVNNYELSYRVDGEYAFFINAENKLLIVCNMNDYSAQVYDFGTYTPLMNSFSWGQENSVWGIVKRDGFYYIVKVDVNGGIFTYYTLPNNFTDCTAFSASELSNSLCVATNGNIYVYSNLQLTGGNIANINNWSIVGIQTINNLWSIEDKFYGITNTNYILSINTNGSTYSFGGYTPVGENYIQNNILRPGVINNNTVVAYYDGSFKYSTNFFSSNTPSFSTVTINGLDDNVSRVIYSERDNRWYFYGLDTNGNTKIYYISNIVNDSLVTSNILNINMDGVTQSSKMICSLGNDSNDEIEGVLADGTVISILSDGTSAVKGYFGVTQGLSWKKVIRCNNQYVGLAQYFNDSTYTGISFVVYSDDGVTWRGGYGFTGIYNDIIFANCALFISGYSDNKYLLLCSTDYSATTSKNNNTTDMYNSVSYELGTFTTMSTVSTGLSCDGINIVCIISNQSENNSILASVNFVYNNNTVNLDIVTDVYDGYLSDPVSVTQNIFYFIQSNNRIASVYKYIFNTSIESVHEFILNEDSVALATEFDRNEGTFYIILNNLVYDYRYLDVIIGNSQYSTSAMVYVNGNYLYNAPTPVYSPSAFSSGNTIKGILNGEIADSITDCGAFIYLTTPSGAGYYSKTIK